MKFAACVLLTACLSTVVYMAAKQDENVYMRVVDGPLPGNEQYRRPELSPAPGRVKSFWDRLR